jgi:hypothetical protein
MNADNSKETIHPFFANHREIFSELDDLQRQMSSNLSTNIMSLKSAADEFYRKNGVCPELALQYPDAAREIALMQLRSIPQFLVSPSCTSVNHVTQVSEDALWWMQTYGPHGSRLDCFKKCITIAQKIITTFSESEFYHLMTPFQRCYNRLIPHLLNNTKFQPLCNALIDAFSIVPTSDVSTQINSDSEEVQLNIPPPVVEVHHGEFSVGHDVSELSECHQTFIKSCDSD